MTAQAIALAVLVVGIVVTLEPLLLRDLRRTVDRAADRRLGGWWVDTDTGKMGRSRFIQHGTMLLGAFSRTHRTFQFPELDLEANP